MSIIPPGLRQASSGFKGVLWNTGGMVQRAISSTQSHGTGKAIELSFRPLVPLILAGSALLYHQGQEATKPNGGDRRTWLRVLMESGLGYFILDKTSGVYPLFGIGLAAYRAGQKPDALEQTKAIINTAVNLGMGYIGVNIFKGMSKMGQQLDDHVIYRALHDQDRFGNPRKEKMINQWISSLQKNTDEAMQGLGQELQELKGKLGEMYGDFKPAADKKKLISSDSDIFKALAERVGELKANIAGKFDDVGEEALKNLKSSTAKTAAKELMGSINYSQSSLVQMTRALNPVFGFLIVGWLLGNPLAKWITSWVENRYPALKQKKLDRVLFPENNRVMKNFNAYGGGNNANGAYGDPYIVWPGVNGDRPLR